MKHRILRAFVAVPVAGLLATFQPGAMSGTVTVSAESVYDHLTTDQKALLSGFASLELDPATTPSALAPQRAGGFFPTGDDGCPLNLGSNIKVNQNCLNITDLDLQGRAQAHNETAIAQDPRDPQHLIASSNDYRRGDGNCFSMFSRDGGRNWTDTSIPMSFTRGAAFGGVQREYWQAGGDPAVAWDTKGNAYMQCMVFERGPAPVTNNPDQSSAVYVFRSTGNSGASWNFPGRPAVESFVTNPTGLPLNDKPYMTIDTHQGSPFQDRIYITWTVFASDGTAKIYEVHSNNYGESFSAPVLVSGSSAFCVHSVVGTQNCDANQFSQPITGPDGALYVVFDNYSTAKTTDNHDQVLIARSTDGGASFGPLRKVADFYNLPDCATYQGGQDRGRACVPEKGAQMRSVFRAENYPAGAVNPDNPSQVVVTFGSYINRFSNENNGCAPAGTNPATHKNRFTGVKTPGACNNKIVLSVSNNGGTTFTGTTTDPRDLPTVNTSRQAGTDQWWQWATFSNSGKFGVSYYDRQYGNDEFNGFSDLSLSGSQDLHHFGVVRVTSASMPVPTQFPDAQGNSIFFGDYTGITAATDALPLWMDTRDPDLALCPGTGAPGVPPKVCAFDSANGTRANTQDIFTARIGIPSGGED